MSAVHMEGVFIEAAFAEDYARAFDDFVRHIKRQGIPVSDRVMEAAHERATKRATDAARARGYRSFNFAPLAKAGLAQARKRHGY
jgi:predicted O-methyltransferase YrrM